MKRILICFAIISVILSGCGPSAQKIKEPVKFYYPVNIIEFNTDSGVIAHEIREAAGFQNTEDLLSEYLKGPNGNQLSCPFPGDVALVSVDTVNSTCTVILNEHFASLTGLDLTIACHCLGMTLLEHTGANTVEIMAADAELDGQNSIIINSDSFLLVDNSARETVPPQE